MTAVEFLILALATFRVSSLFVKETGPGRLFLKLREGFGIVHDQDDKILIVPETFLAGIFSCVWCFSIWAGAFWGIFYHFSPDITLGAATIFALSAAAILTEKML